MATLKLKIPYLIVRKGRSGARRFYWQPATALRTQGWRPVPLGADEDKAIADARQLNADLQAWRRGQRPISANDNRSGVDQEKSAPPSRKRRGKRLSWAEVLDRHAEEIANAVRDPGEDPEQP